jgi:hypothetical protein
VAFDMGLPSSLVTIPSKDLAIAALDNPVHTSTASLANFLIYTLNYFCAKHFSILIVMLYCNNDLGGY